MSRKFILIILMFFLMLFNLTSQSAGNNEAFLNFAEKKLFNATYHTNTIEKRLSRLEKNIYGVEKKNLTTDIRISNLKKVPALSQQQAILPVQNIPDTNTKKQNIEKQPQIQINPPQQKDIGYYPAIDRLEQQVLKNTYKTDDIYQRLNRLENAVYKKTYSDKDLAWRTDNLNASIFKEEPPRAMTQEEYDLNEQTLTTLVGELENAVLNQTYPTEIPLNRIRRLERTIYNTTYDDDSTYSRLERIVATVEATQRPRTYEYAYPARGFGYNNPYHTVNNTNRQNSSNDMLPFLFFLLLGLFI